jgi:prolyl-tRNA synthetase
MKVSREKWSSNFNEWYDWVLREAQIYDYGRYPVKGMGVWMPYGFRIREKVVSLIRKLLNDTGHEEVLFPLLIPEDLLRRESEHIKGFEDEVFWVTKGGESDLDVKLALRPTSEVAITYMESLWHKTYRDLPKKYYQIVSIFRYETKATRPLLRLREVTTFKEAHTLHESFEDAESQVKEAVGIYSKFFNELGIPFLISRRPEWDKFAGAVYTVAFDTVMPDNRVMQIGTVHHLGDNFTKALDVRIQNRKGDMVYPHQTSYGISDRIIAAVVSLNGDDHGPVLHPGVAPIHVVVIPIPSKGSEEETRRIKEYALRVYRTLVDGGISCTIDLNDERTPGDKFYYWELRGIPLRAEIGPRELRDSTVYLKRRDTFEAFPVKLDSLTREVRDLLERQSHEMSKAAWERFNATVRQEADLKSAKEILRDQGGVVEVPWCGEDSCGMKMEELTEARVLGVPLDKPFASEGKCVLCGRTAKSTLRLAKTY